MPTFKIYAFGKTDPGISRQDNEDNLLVDNDQQLYAVADGLGGLPEGGRASRMAAEQLGQAQGNFNLAELLTQVNEAVYKKGVELAGELGMGTTLTAVHVAGRLLSIAHVGDSGVVVFNQAGYTKLTKDHTMAEQIRDRLEPGQEDTYIPEYFEHTLVRCIGQAQTIEVDTARYTLSSGDRVLLYTDGVTKALSLTELQAEIQQASSPEAFVEAVIGKANERGGVDNATAIALFVE